MKVLKFGGTSVGSAHHMKNVVTLINDPTPKIVVLSAMKGTTDHLVEIVSLLYKKNHHKANQAISELESKYSEVVTELLESKESIVQANQLIKSHFDHIRTFTQDLFTQFEEKSVLAQGELITTALFQLYLEEQEINSTLLPALNFMRTDKDGEPDQFYIKENLKRELSDIKDKKIIITQGYICRNAFGEIDNLKRGGSDFSAALIGAAIQADEIQIWTDIDGMHNNDPRIVEDTTPLKYLSFDEAAELAYFGAKILHPYSILPCKFANIPVRLKNTMDPKRPGTLISKTTEGTGIKAIAVKDHITAIKIKSARMLMAYGFLRKVFEIFESFKTAIDMVTTSEVAVSITIDDTKYLKEIITELEKYGSVETDQDISIICIVGNFIAESKGYATQVFNALKDVPIRMISYGGSSHNISLLINTSNKEKALKTLHQKLFSHV